MTLHDLLTSLPELRETDRVKQNHSHSPFIQNTFDQEGKMNVLLSADVSVTTSFARFGQEIAQIVVRLRDQFAVQVLLERFLR